jgi:hypothetical protein
MLDLSEIGARFTIDEQVGALDLQGGAELSIEVKNQFGATACGGKIAWAYRIDDRYLLGVEFSEVSPYKRDPIRCLMESQF